MLSGQKKWQVTVSVLLNGQKKWRVTVSVVLSCQKKLTVYHACPRACSCELEHTHSLTKVRNITHANNRINKNRSEKVQQFQLVIASAKRFLGIRHQIHRPYVSSECLNIDPTRRSSWPSRPYGSYTFSRRVPYHQKKKYIYKNACQPSTERRTCVSTPP